MRFFLDQGVPDGVGREFRAAGHEVIHLRDVIATDSPDNVVCVAAEENEAILVACDGDMRQLVKPFGIGNERFKKLSLVKFNCKSPQAQHRAKAAMAFLEHEWAMSLGKTPRRIHIHIGASVLSTHR